MHAVLPAGHCQAGMLLSVAVGGSSAPVLAPAVDAPTQSPAEAGEPICSSVRVSDLKAIWCSDLLMHLFNTYTASARHNGLRRLAGMSA